MPGALRDARLWVEIHDDHFAQNARDPEWLTGAGKNNWIVVTRDERIRYRVAEDSANNKAAEAALHRKDFTRWQRDSPQLLNDLLTCVDSP
jgi:hypothetical protein